MLSNDLQAIINALIVGVIIGFTGGGAIFAVRVIRSPRAGIN